jgi:MFS family permease
MSAASPALTRIFHGWWVVLAGFVCTMMAIGSTTYSFGLFVTPLSTEFGMSRANANTGFILLLLGFAVWAPLVGRVLDRVSARAVMVTGAWLFALGLSLIATASTPWLMGLAVFGPVALGTVACGALAANTVTSRWFLRHRGKAMGLLAVATSAGGFTMPPLIAFLMETFGWRTALMLQGAGLASVATMIVLLFVRDRPSDIGVLPDGVSNEGERASQVSTIAATESEAIWSFGRMLGSANFWLIACGAGILLGADQALLVSMIPYGTDAGLGLQQATLLVSCLTFSAILGKLAIGALADRVDKRWLFCAVAACNLAFLVVLTLQPDYAVLLVACCIIGLAIGGTYPLWMTLTADCFGSASFGVVMGSMNLVVMPFSIIAVRYIGVVFDQSGSYQQAFTTFMVTAVVSTVLILAVRLPRKS